MVKIYYRLSRFDGSLVEENFSTEKPLLLKASESSMAFREIIPLLNVGSKGHFLIRSTLLYGRKGNPFANIQGGELTSFVVELVAIESEQ